MLRFMTLPAARRRRTGGKLPGRYEAWSPEYISVGFIAKRCGVSNTTVLRWINTRQLPAFKLPGGHFRVGRTDLTEFLDKNNMRAPSANADKGR
jgi:excisionase family DNA binding protein